MTDLWQRLKQRKLVQWALAYIAFAFAVIQVLDVVAQRFGWPAMIERLLIVALAVGFFVTVVLAWYHGERGAQRMTGIELLILALLLAIGGSLLWRFARMPAGSPDYAAAATSSGLHTVGAQAVPIPAKSIAVLPFSNESGDPQQDYFSDGLSEELISAIAQVHEIKVIGRNSSFQFRGKQQDNTAAIGAKLGVATLLEGTVRKQGNEIRIVASLIKASDGSELWSQTYDRQLKDVFALQSDIATAVAGALKIALLGQTIQATDKPPSGNLDAYEALLQGRKYAERRNRADYFKAVNYYQQAIKLDPNYATAYARLAIAQQWFNDWVANTDERKLAGAQARTNALKAIELAPQSALALGALGINQAWSDFDYPSAQGTLKKAVALDPSDPETLYQLADVTACLGRLDQGIAMMRRVLVVEPLNASFHFYTGQFLLAAGKPNAAEAELSRAIALQPDAAAFHAYLAIALLQRGRSDQALRTASDEPDLPTRRWALSTVHFARGETTQGRTLLDAMIRLDMGFSPSNIAMVYASIGSNDKAFAMLDHALEVRDPGVASIYEQPYLISKLRGDPRLEVLLKKLGLPTPSQVAAQRAASATFPPGPATQ